MSDGNELNTNEKKTKKEVQDFLDQCPEHALFNAYEGEGGSWIIATWDEDDQEDLAA